MCLKLLEVIRSQIQGWLVKLDACQLYQAVEPSTYWQQYHPSTQLAAAAVHLMSSCSVTK